MATKKPSKTEMLIESADQVSALWMDFRKCLQKAFSNQEVTHAEEQHFLEVKSNLSRLQRVLSQRLPDGIHYGAKRMTGIMGQAVSIAALREMPLPDKKSLYRQWHETNIAIESVRGIVDVIHEGYPVTLQSSVQVRSGNIKAELGGGKAKKKKKSSTALAAVVLIVIAAAVWWYMTNN